MAQSGDRGGAYRTRLVLCKHYFEVIIMASIKPGPIVTKIRGSIAGVTFGAGPGGDTARRKPKPPYPGTSYQAQIRSFLVEAGKLWQVQDETERGGWNDYALTVTLTNRLGEPFHPSGANMWTRQHLFRQRAGGAIGWVSRPAADGLPTVHVPTLTYSAGDLVMTGEVPDWEDGDKNLVEVFRAQMLRGKNQMPYVATVVESDPPSWPYTILADCGGVFTIGRLVRIWVRVQTRDIDWRVGSNAWSYLDFVVA